MDKEMRGSCEEVNLGNVMAAFDDGSSRRFYQGECSNSGGVGRECELESSGTEFDDLDRDCKALIMMRSSPRDVEMMSRVSRELSEVADFEDVWKGFLPPNIRDLLSTAHPALPQRYITSTPAREMFHDLTFPVHIDSGNKMFWIDGKSGKRSLMVSAMRFELDDWVDVDDARFSKAALVIPPRRVNVTGQFECGLLSPSTEYTVSYKMRSLGSFPRSQRCLPCRPSISEDGRRVMTSEDRKRVRTWRRLERGWIEFDIGKFYVGRHGSGAIQLSVRVVPNIPFQFDGLIFRPTLIVDRLEVLTVDRQGPHITFPHLHVTSSFKHAD